MPALSPINRRRLQRFKANRRGWWSLWLFTALLVICLCGELVANDKPLLLSHNGTLYFPIFKPHPKPNSAGSSLPPDYRSEYVRHLIEDHGGWMLFPPIPFSYDTVNYDLTVPSPSPPPRRTGWAPTNRRAMCWHACFTAHGYRSCSRWH